MPVERADTFDNPGVQKSPELIVSSPSHSNICCRRAQRAAVQNPPHSQPWSDKCPKTVQNFVHYGPITWIRENPVFNAPKVSNPKQFISIHKHLNFLTSSLSPMILCFRLLATISHVGVRVTSGCDRVKFRVAESPGAESESGRRLETAMVFISDIL